MGSVPQWQVSWEDSVGSTMDLAGAAARGTEPSGRVFAAREQTAGRGRLGRAWVSPPGGLYASVLLREPHRELAPLLPFCGALAVQRALAPWVSRTPLRVKWPNDVLVMGAGEGGRDGKIAGVLTQAGAVGARLMWAVVGFGVNVDVDEGRLPHDVDPPAVNLSRFVDPVPSLDALLRSMLDAFGQLLVTHRERPGGLVEEVLEVLAYRDQEVRIELGREDVLQGVLTGLDAAGNALIEADGQETRVAAWDAQGLRPA